MARKATPKDGSGKTTSMKVNVDVHRRAKMVALHRGIELFDYVHGVLSPVVMRDYEQMIRDESKGK